MSLDQHRLICSFPASDKSSVQIYTIYGISLQLIVPTKLVSFIHNTQ